MRQPADRKTRLSGWGRYPIVDCRELAPRDENALRAAVTAEESVIARGNGRAYGDAALNPQATISLRHFDRMLAFDAETGHLTAEAGVLLSDVIGTFLPRGWFPGVVPGTKHVSVGGMAAADVHGKNDHRHGSFGRCVDWLDLMTADGEIVRCSRGENPDLFAWTVGGMGLTGVIVRVRFRLVPVESGWMRQRRIVTSNLESTFDGLDAESGSNYVAAWVDAATGRGLVVTGEHAPVEGLPVRERTNRFPPAIPARVRVPSRMPGFLLNGASVRTFNAMYYRRGRRGTDEAPVHWDSFFFPLDRVSGWNRLYGRRGLCQFQCVIPHARARAGIATMVEEIERSRASSFLAVLKPMGASEGRFSFPTEGYSIALDFPITDTTLSLMERLDRIAVDHGGRFYLAKDARMSAGTLRAADPRAGAFEAARADRGWSGRFASAQSRRLGL